MYDELVKKLRELASIPEYCEKVANCDQCSKEDLCLSFTNKRIIETATQAADAIEQLQKAVLRLENESGLLDELPMYQQPVGWVPVAERLPELNENVLVYSAHSGLICIDANIWFDRNATHWMPLPQPPKEET